MDVAVKVEELPDGGIAANLLNPPLPDAPRSATPFVEPASSRLAPPADDKCPLAAIAGEESAEAKGVPNTQLDEIERSERAAEWLAKEANEALGGIRKNRDSDSDNGGYTSAGSTPTVDTEDRLRHLAKSKFGYDCSTSSSVEGREEGFEDPLDHWISRMERLRESGDDKGHSSIVRRCFRTFTSRPFLFPSCQNNPRFLRVCICYADMHSEPTGSDSSVFHQMYRLGIGTKQAMFWVEWGLSEGANMRQLTWTQPDIDIAGGEDGERGQRRGENKKIPALDAPSSKKTVTLNLVKYERTDNGKAQEMGDKHQEYSEGEETPVEKEKDNENQANSEVEEAPVNYNETNHKYDDERMLASDALQVKKRELGSNYEAEGGGVEVGEDHKMNYDDGSLDTGSDDVSCAREGEDWKKSGGVNTVAIKQEDKEMRAEDRNDNHKLPASKPSLLESNFKPSKGVKEESTCGEDGEMNTGCEVLNELPNAVAYQRQHSARNRRVSTELCNVSNKPADPAIMAGSSALSFDSPDHSLGTVREESRNKELFVYVGEHKNANVPQGALGTWDHTQQQLFKKNKLAEEQISIQALGWDVRYAELIKYTREHGNANVPQGYKYNSALGTWVRRQRNMFKKNKLAEEKISRLRKLGFKFSVKEPLVTWDVRYAELIAYVKEHGNANVPTTHEQNRALGPWVGRQRHMFKKNKLAEERIGRLRKLGFKFSVRVFKVKQAC